jgi:hypothetical protein
MLSPLTSQRAIADTILRRSLFETKLLWASKMRNNHRHGAWRDPATTFDWDTAMRGDSRDEMGQAKNTEKYGHWEHWF